MIALFFILSINTTMRAEEFIAEYATANKPHFAVTEPCTGCDGTGNISTQNKTQTCPLCSGTGSMLEVPNDSEIMHGYQSDLDHMKNRPQTLWAAGKF